MIGRFELWCTSWETTLFLVHLDFQRIRVQCIDLSSIWGKSLKVNVFALKLLSNHSVFSVPTIRILINTFSLVRIMRLNWVKSNSFMLHLHVHRLHRQRDSKSPLGKIDEVILICGPNSCILSSLAKSVINS